MTEQKKKVKACKDTEYLFISAYLRAKEPQLLNAEKAGRMLGSSVQEAARILESCGYADVLAVGLDKALSDRRAAVFSEVEALTPKDGVVALFRMRYDYHNAKAMLMTRGLTETARLGVALGAKKETFAGLAGVGDLIVTCTSMHSRNRRAGILIGQGKDPQTAMKEVGAVVEGYYAAKSAYELGKAKGIDMPITDAAYKVLYEGADVKDAVQALLSRQRKSESEDAGWQ